MVNSSLKKTTKLSYSQKIKKQTITKLPRVYVKIGARSHKPAIERA